VSVKSAVYDFFGRRLDRAGIGRRRDDLLREARGRVLEVGAGTGFNLAHYPRGLDELVLLEPDCGFAERIERRLHGLPASIVDGTAESLPFEDASFDTVVSTFVLCTVDDLERSLAEIRRVLRPGGALLFLEHVRSDDPRLARWQDRLDRPWYGLVSDGCHCNRDTLAEIGRGLTVIEVEHGEMPVGLPIVRPLIAGRALRPEAAEA
jgi:ubiquinone/menaquinone biosynthesis C-methylase UbiE